MKKTRVADGATMTFPYRDASPRPDPNEKTLVVRLDVRGRRLLQAGEREEPQVEPASRSIEGRLLSCYKAELAADVLVVGHHRFLTSFKRPFLDAVGATTSVISSGPHPRRGVVLSDPQVVTELTGCVRLLRTDEADGQWEVAVAKVGPDADESPGGCSSVLVTVAPAGIVAGPGYRSD